MSAISVTRRYTFSASHRLNVNEFSEEQNREVFGKCNNPHGHGHNYELFVTVRGPIHQETGLAVETGKLDGLVESHVLEAFHHRNMNSEVAAFADVAATTENVGIEIRRRLEDHWEEAFPLGVPALEKLRICETGRNIFVVFAQHT